MSTDPNELPSLDSLSSRIEKAKKSEGNQVEEQVPRAGLSLAMRTGVELVSGVAVGAVIGYAIDSGLDSFPLFFLICFLLGTAAGILNMMRSVNRELSKHDNIQDKT